MKKVRNGIKQGAITIISDTCAVDHVSVSYAKDAIENVEATLVHPLTGEEKTGIIIDRNRSTMNTKKQISQAIDFVKDKIKDLTDVKPGTAEDVVIETDTYGDA